MLFSGSLHLTGDKLTLRFSVLLPNVLLFQFFFQGGSDLSELPRWR